MPIYEYRCKECGEEFERVEAISEHEAAEVRCPGCESRRVERRWGRVQVVTRKKS